MDPEAYSLLMQVRAVSQTARRFELERDEVRQKMADAQTQLSAYDALLAGAFPRIPRIPDPNE